MNVKRLRELRVADPYKPFYLVMTDGTRLPVKRAVFLAISPTGTEISYSPVEGGFKRIRVKDIADAVVDETLKHEWNLKKN